MASGNVNIMARPYRSTLKQDGFCVESPPGQVPGRRLKGGSDFPPTLPYARSQVGNRRPELGGGL